MSLYFLVIFLFAVSLLDHAKKILAMVPAQKPLESEFIRGKCITWSVLVFCLVIIKRFKFCYFHPRWWPLDPRQPGVQEAGDHDQHQQDQAGDRWRLPPGCNNRHLQCQRHLSGGILQPLVHSPSPLIRLSVWPSLDVMAIINSSINKQRNLSQIWTLFFLMRELLV